MDTENALYEIDELYKGFGEICHIGVARRSGRYPWGSGENPYQSSYDFLGRVKELKDKGLNEKEIAEALGLKSTQELRNRKSIARTEYRAACTREALRLKDKGYSNVAIGERMHVNESTVRSWLDPVINARTLEAQKTVDVLKQAVENKKYVDVGLGSEIDLGITRTKMKVALQMLQDEGYTIHHIHVKQVATGKDTEVLTLAAPDVKYQEVYNNKANIKSVVDISNDGFGLTSLGMERPKSIDSKRILIRYNEEGGLQKDGTIELRPGVDDISLGNSRYAQVRVAVDDKYYLKGMAIYSNDIPDGYDIIVNSNKHLGTPPEKVFKPLKKIGDSDEVNWENPFGASIKVGGQRHYTDENGEDQLSLINKVNEEGDWGTWSKSLSSQVLSKQPIKLAKQQLDLDYKIRMDEYNQIMNLTNPVIKKKLLQDFADGCDAAAVDLKAAALPRQASHVILPIGSLKDNEVYAPNYVDGETVVLIRYPHAGKFEIPQLVVNNKNKEAKSILANATDAIGINSSVAEKLSGADFDGDTVLVIPNNKGLIKVAPTLEKLKDFDPKEYYKAYEGMPKVGPETGFHKQTEMGKVSNLITDMTIKGADSNELARAVKHSMCVIDAEKHNLDWRGSYVDNGIAELKAKYQGVNDRGQLKGASTLISRASSEYRDLERKTNNPYTIDPDTGERLWNYTGAMSLKKDKTTGKYVETNKPKTTVTTKMDVVKDARELSSGYPIEEVYATYANSMKALGNTARKSMISTKNMEYKPEAAKEYAQEVASLKAKLLNAQKNAPRERQAQIYANNVLDGIKKDNPGMSFEEEKKVSGQALVSGRAKMGAKKERIIPSDKEWEAIQSGAVSTNILEKIIANTDLDSLRKLATPRDSKEISSSYVSLAKSMANNGYTQSEIAERLGVSSSTINNILKE